MEPWPKFDLREIELPATVRVPDGALQTNTARDGSRRGLLRRSTCTKPLAEQVATLNCIAGIIADELDKPLEECRLEGSYLTAAFDDGLLIEGNYRQRPGEHPESPVAAKNVSNVSSFMGREDAPLSPMHAWLRRHGTCSGCHRPLHPGLASCSPSQAPPQAAPRSPRRSEVRLGRMST